MAEIKSNTHAYCKNQTNLSCCDQDQFKTTKSNQKSDQNPKFGTRFISEICSIFQSVQRKFNWYNSCNQISNKQGLNKYIHLQIYNFT